MLQYTAADDLGGGDWEEKTHSFWIRWSDCDKLAAAVAAACAGVIKAEKAKAPGSEPPSPPMAFPSKWSANRARCPPSHLHRIARVAERTQA